MKTRTSKCRKIEDFPNGLTYGFVSNMAIFPTFFVRKYWLVKWLLRWSRTKKRLSRQFKEKVPNVEKLTFFQKGLTHGFGPNMAIFPIFFFWHYRLGKWLFRYSILKKRLSRQYIQTVPKVEKFTFFKRG